MDNTAAQAQQNTNQQAEKTFTQAELDAIIADRLARERGKYADYDTLKDKAARFDAQVEAEKTDLQKAQEQAASLQTQLNALKAETAARNVRDKVAAAKGIPATLLHGSTEEECNTEADALLAFRGGQQAHYPDTHAQGETTPPPSGKTRDQFADWFNKNLR